MNENMRRLFFLLVLALSIPLLARQGSSSAQESGSAWGQLSQSMEKMHAGMYSIKPSGSDDADFVRLMLTHHQAAIDMAKVELTQGKDPQIRRLAQEIIIDQQSEIDLMHLWLKQHGPDSQKIGQESPMRDMKD
jgi:uncharacterized protein (DUF305 family)